MQCFNFVLVSLVDQAVSPPIRKMLSGFGISYSNKSAVEHSHMEQQAFSYSTGIMDLGHNDMRCQHNTGRIQLIKYRIKAGEYAHIRVEINCLCYSRFKQVIDIVRLYSGAKLGKII